MVEPANTGTVDEAFAYGDTIYGGEDDREDDEHSGNGLPQ